MRSTQTLTFLLAAAASARAASDLEYTSFGQHGSIWGNTGDHSKIPGWRLIGDKGYTPDILSDRVILTPPYPGNKRGAIWAERAQSDDQWTADFDFRASGPERASGNLQLWYAKEGHDVIGTASIYTIGKFDGMSIVVSQYGGQGGSVRGFLNDGQTSFKDHHNVDRLAFGTCDFPYRNLGRFIRLSVKQTSDSIEVEVDGRPCFKTDKAKLPSGYHFGVTAATAEIPDSFEAKSLVITKAAKGNTAAAAKSVPDNGASNQQQAKDASPTSPNDGSWYWITKEKENIKDGPASSFNTDAQRFEDLHYRLSAVNTALDVLYHDLTTFKSQTEMRHEELIHKLNELSAWMRPTHDHAESSRRMIEDMKKELKVIKDDVESRDYREHLNHLHRVVREGNQEVMDGMPQAVNSMIQSNNPMRFYIFLLIGSQASLLGLYTIYKRRKDSQFKKYL